MSPARCDHKSVGILVRRDDRVLLIGRKRPPFGFAAPAGHVDGDATFAVAAARELREEVGLVASSLTLVAAARKDNACRRAGGTWHYWEVFEATAQGEPRGSDEETTSVLWAGADDLARLARLAPPPGAPLHSPNAGLERVWLEWLTELRYLPPDEVAPV